MVLFHPKEPVWASLCPSWKFQGAHHRQTLWLVLRLHLCLLDWPPATKRLPNWANYLSAPSPPPFAKLGQECTVWLEERATLQGEKDFWQNPLDHHLFRANICPFFPSETDWTMLAAPFTMTPTYFLLEGEKKAFSPKTFTWKEQGQIRSQIPIHAFLLAQGSLFPAITDNMGDIDNPLRWTVTWLTSTIKKWLRPCCYSCSALFCEKLEQITDRQPQPPHVKVFLYIWDFLW